MGILFRRNRLSIGNCASCRSYRTTPRHPANNNSSEPYCEIDPDANLKSHIRELEWWVCLDWDLLDDHKAAQVYKTLLDRWAYDYLKPDYAEIIEDMVQ